jgi:nucleotide-binding universal stress UspA family protein
MYDRILVPLDGSGLAEQVLLFVTRISLGMGIPIHLIQVVHTVPEDMADPVHGLYRSSITDGMHDEAIDYLNSIKRKTAGAEITCEALEGNVSSIIIEEAAKTPGSLVAMSTHGRSGVARWLLGSVTDNVLRHTKNPMLIDHGHREGEPESDTNLSTIIIPMDGSPMAEEVIPHVAALANALDLEVTLLHASATAEEFGSITGFRRLDGVSGGYFQNFEDMARDARNQAIDYLNGMEDKLRKQGVTTIESRIERGPAADVIVDAALDTPDNLVAMTTHGRSGPARWTLGSVADRVVRHSGEPVLVVRTG